MTTRVRTFGDGTTPLEEYSVAIGTDGQYETVSGRVRSKWNNYQATFDRYVRTPGRNPSISLGDIYWSGNASVGSQIKANDYLTVLSRLSENVKGHNFNLAVNAAQGKQTVGMVVNALNSIGGAILDLKRGKFESAARRFGVASKPSRLSEKDISGRWLELQYGWLPAISDVYEAAKAYESLTSDSRVSRVSASVNRQYQIDVSNSPSNYSVLGTRREGIRIIYEMSEQLTTARSLGLTDPASVLWEIIPYSFVVDWFIPIGSYLENLNTIPRLSGRFLTTTTRRFQGSARIKGGSAHFSKWVNYPTCFSKQFYMNREVSTNLSVPKPNFVSLPDAMSPTRIWNSIALATQKIR